LAINLKDVFMGYTGEAWITLRGASKCLHDGKLRKGL